MLADAKTTETELTLMTRRKAFFLFLIISGITLVAALIFVASATNVVVRYAPQMPAPVNKLSIKTKIEDLGPLNQYIIIETVPSLRSQGVELIGHGLIQFLDENSFQIYNSSISFNHTFSQSSERYVIFEKSFVDFSSMYVTIDYEAPDNTISDMAIILTSLDHRISVASIISISVVTALVILMLIFVVSRRVRPSKLDHWMTIILAGTLVLIDGPWLVCSYYALPAFTQVFDAMSQIFHTFFIVYSSYFFGARSPPPVAKFFISPIIIFCLIFASAMLMTLEFINTDLMPLSTFAIIAQRGMLYNATIGLFATFHLIVIVYFIFGFLSINIERFWSLLLVVFMFTSLELIQVFTFIGRLFISPNSVGISAAIDVFYILMANVVTMFLLYVNTPVAKASSADSMFLVQQPEIMIE